MQHASEHILKHIREAGHRLTGARREIVDLLLKNTKPLSIPMITEKASADEASVYRTISLLQELGILEEIVEPGAAKRYAIAEEHHHHIICTNCGRVAHIPCDPQAEKRVHHSDFAKIADHAVTYYGVCHTCA